MDKVETTERKFVVAQEKNTVIAQSVLGILALFVGVSGLAGSFLRPDLPGSFTMISLIVSGILFAAFFVFFFEGLDSKGNADRKTAKSLQKWAEREHHIHVPLSNLLPMVEADRENPTGRVRAVMNEQPVVAEFTEEGEVLLFNSAGTHREPAYTPS